MRYLVPSIDKETDLSAEPLVVGLEQVLQVRRPGSIEPAHQVDETFRRGVTSSAKPARAERRYFRRRLARDKGNTALVDDLLKISAGSYD